MERKLYTIGYATKNIETFIACLKKHGITCLIDVRTSPFSKTFPDYDKPRLKETLKNEGILYAHFGAEFGARRSEQEAYSISYTLKGERIDQVDFQKVYNLPLFQQGVKRVFNGIEKGYNICFMCSEKHPVDCHRFWMVAFYFATLKDNPFEIVNIVTEDETQIFDDVVNEVDIEKEKSKFFKKHNDELGGFALFDIEIPSWVKHWDDFFMSNESRQTKAQKFSNIRIGFVKGDEDHD